MLFPLLASAFLFLPRQAVSRVQLARSNRQFTSFHVTRLEKHPENTQNALTSEEAQQQARAEELTLLMAENKTGDFGVHDKPE